MRTRFGIIFLTAAAFLAVVATAAMADPADQVNGQGQTPLSASIGFNVDGTLAGQLTYNSDPKGATPDFWAQCDDFSSVSFVDVPSRRQVAKVTAACTDKDGNTVYLRASFVDRGEPGTRDSVCVLWSYDPSVKESSAYLHEMGYISNGNIQVHLH